MCLIPAPSRAEVDGYTEIRRSENDICMYDTMHVGTPAAPCTLCHCIRLYTLCMLVQMKYADTEYARLPTLWMPVQSRSAQFPLYTSHCHSPIAMPSNPRHHTFAVARLELTWCWVRAKTIG